MNNTHPPYGDPNQWNQQNVQQPGAGQPLYGQVPQADHPPAPQEATAGYPQSGYPQAGYPQSGYSQQGYGQPFAQSQGWQYQNWQPQSHQPQEAHSQQSWQPYGQQEARAGYPQAGYPQAGYPQSDYVQQPYGQQLPQPGYSQGAGQAANDAVSLQGQQAHQQSWQAPQQGYQNGNAQQGYQPPMQNGQPLQQGQQPPQRQSAQFFPAQGYSGYVTRPGDGRGGMRFDAGLLMKVALFGVLPVLFLLWAITRAPVMCGLFLAGTAAAVAVMWVWPLVEANLRLISTMIASVLALVVLVLTLFPAKQTGQQQTTDGSANAHQATQPDMGVTWEPTPIPTSPPPTDSFAEYGAAQDVLQTFFYYWHTNNFSSMLALTAPSWRNAQADPEVALFTIQANRTPEDDCVVERIDGTENDTSRTAKVRVTMTRNITGREPEVYSFNVVMLKEDEQWYVDPRTLSSNVKETATKAATNPMPTQPVLNEGYDTMVLYYNPNDGELYHVDANCPSTNARYLPFKGQFLFSQLNADEYKHLKNCTRCGAPLREGQ